MKNWREASTVIIAAKNNLKSSSQCDYRILTARRNVESRFMPNSHVFPGGAIDQEDSSQEWEKLHKKLNFKKLKLEDFKIHSDKLELFKTPKEEYLPRFISLRIAAIRETFEECGILICRNNDENLEGYGHIIENHDKSPKDDRPFLEVCKTLKCFPDVWALHEARNWLTPNHLPKRFDTAFFFVALNKIPATTMDPREVSEIKWSVPTELLKLHESGSLWLPPPQLYEISKISRYQHLESLRRAAEKHEFCSKVCFLPVIVSLTDGIAFVLPGDSCYEAATQDAAQFQNESLASFRALASKHLRTEMTHETKKTVFVETKDDATTTKDLLSKI